jgi:hypothetical protein
MQTKTDKPKGYEPSADYRISSHPAHESNLGSTPRELSFEGGDPLAKRSVRGLLIVQSLAEIEGNEHENPEKSDQHALPPGYLRWPMVIGRARLSIRPEELVGVCTQAFR